MYGRSVQILSLVFIVLGAIALVSTFSHGGGPLSLGAILGVAFLAVGILRLWLSGLFRERRDRTRGQGLS